MPYRRHSALVSKSAIAVPAQLGPPERWVERHGLPVAAVLLSSGGPVGPDARYSALMLSPVSVLQCRVDETSVDPFAALDELRAALPMVDASIDFPCPLVVYVMGYELGRRLERVGESARDERHVADFFAARYDAAYVWDRALGRGHVVGVDEAATAALIAAINQGPSLAAPLDISRPVPMQSQAEHALALEAIHEAIRQGEVYQLNYTVRFEAKRRGGQDPSALYLRLLRHAGGPYSALLRFDDDRALMCASPERFLKWAADRSVQTRPIKGTRPRMGDPASDATSAQALLESAKDHAEHVMIVDVERNDLGRVCELGSVKVPKLCVLETHETVFHLVSTVEGRLRADVTDGDLFRATFPGGSITGAPKIRAMQLIDSLEPVRRGPYCGSLGYLDARGGGDANILIRTAWTTEDAVYYQAGGGIVIESDAESEWAEAMVKALAFIRAATP